MGTTTDYYYLFVQAKRCIILVQGNRKAGLHFYASLRQCVAAGPLCKFIGVLYKLLCKCIERAASSGAGAKDNGKGKGKRARDEEEKSEESTYTHTLSFRACVR